jgi:hypothetical protein
MSTPSDALVAACLFVHHDEKRLAQLGQNLGVRP